MSRIHDYGVTPALRRELSSDLAKSLAYKRTGQNLKAEHWARRLWRHMLKARLISGGDNARYVDELRHSLANED